ncbi:MAG: glycosyltransferase family 39 protein [Bacteroidetes bacterium]|nr:glycosyltransferase family 39 protein [Bacteroidota bacterium]
MKKFISILSAYPWILYTIAILLLFPALLINLGINPVYLASDEAIRALVSLEMIISDDYITPTLQGEIYLKKPPLFNWIIIVFFKIFGNYDELALRLPTILSCLIFGLIIVLFLKKYLGKEGGLIVALIVLTSGRILFWDSFLGLIDITFSVVIFLNFMVIYHFFRKGSYLWLFLLSYLLTAVAFMFKGLPAIVFQGITLLVLFISEKKFLKLISFKHVLGILLFFILTGFYYVVYLNANQDTFHNIIYVLFEQSTRRTGLRFGILRTIEHIFIFPFEVWYHFAPWTILIVFLFRKKCLSQIFSNPFIKYNALIFIFNIIVYWISPEVFPRYLFMFLPLLYTVLYYLMKSASKPTGFIIVSYFFFSIMLIAAAGSVVLNFINTFDDINLRLLKSLFLLLCFSFLIYLYLKIKSQRMVIIVIFLLVSRIAFDWFILPTRAKTVQEFKDQALYVAELTKGEKLYVYKNTVYQHGSSFYISAGRNNILRIKHDNFDKDAYYIVYPYMLEGREYINYYDFEIEWNRRKIKLVRFTDW